MNPVERKRIYVFSTDILNQTEELPPRFLFIHNAAKLLHFLFQLADIFRLQSVAIPLDGLRKALLVDEQDYQPTFRLLLDRIRLAQRNSRVEEVFLLVSDEMEQAMALEFSVYKQMLSSYLECLKESQEKDPECGEKNREQEALPDSADYEIPTDELRLEESFGMNLDRLMDQKKIRPGDFIQRANISRQTLSKLRCHDFVPQKYTALACALALELDLPDTLKLLKTAGYSLSASLKLDVIVSYFIRHRMYDLNAINLVLFEMGIHQLGTRS